MTELCKADRYNGRNYNKPHVPADGLYDGRPRTSCVFCGKWLEDENVHAYSTLLQAVDVSRMFARYSRLMVKPACTEGL